MSDIVKRDQTDLANIDLENMSIEDILAMGRAAQEAVQEEQTQQAAWKPVIDWQLSVPHSEAQSDFIPDAAKGALIMLERACTPEELAERKAAAPADTEIDTNYRVFAQVIPYFPFGRVQAIIKNPATGYDMKRTSRVAYHAEGKGDGVACSSSNGIYPNPKYIGTKVFEPRLGYEITIGYHPHSNQPLRSEDGTPLPICIGCPLSEWKMNGKSGGALCTGTPDYVIYIPAGAPVYELRKKEVPVNPKVKRIVAPEYEKIYVEFPGAFVSIRGRTSGMRQALEGRGDDLMGMMSPFDADKSGVSMVTPDGNPLTNPEGRILWAYLYQTSRVVDFEKPDGTKGKTSQYIVQPILGSDWNEALPEGVATEARLPETMTREDYANMYLRQLLTYKKEGLEAKILRVEETREGIRGAFGVSAPVFSVTKPEENLSGGNIFDDEDDDIIDVNLDN